MEKVLVADDSPIARKFLEGVLSYDYEIHCVTDGEEAISFLVDNEDTSLVFLDVEMPNCDGWEALQVIREEDNWPDIPVVMLTGTDEPADYVRACCLGATSYLVKPLEVAQVLGLVQRLLSGHPFVGS